MVDITTAQDRTRRMSNLDSALPAGLVVGLPVGSYVRNTYGLVPLYSLATGVTLLAMVYVLWVVKESRGEGAGIQEDQDIKSGLACNKGSYYNMNLIVQRTKNFLFRSCFWAGPGLDCWSTNHFQKETERGENLDSLLCTYFLLVQRC